MVKAVVVSPKSSSSKHEVALDELAFVCANRRYEPRVADVNEALDERECAGQLLVDDADVGQQRQGTRPFHP